MQFILLPRVTLETLTEWEPQFADILAWFLTKWDPFYAYTVVIVGAAELYEARCRQHHVVPRD